MPLLGYGVGVTESLLYLVWLNVWSTGTLSAAGGFLDAGSLSVGGGDIGFWTPKIRYAVIDNHHSMGTLNLFLQNCDKKLYLILKWSMKWSHLFKILLY